MRILLDCRPLLRDGPASEKNRLIFSAVDSLARDGSAEWLLLVDQTYRPGLFPGFPPLPLITLRSLPGRPGWKLWYDWQIPRLVRREKPHIVMLTGGVAAASMPAPQCLWMPVRAIPKGRKRGQEPVLYASRLKDSLRRVQTVFCYSEKDRSWLAGLAGEGEDRFALVHPWPSPGASPLSPVEKEKVKAAFTEGKEYFFADAGTAGEQGIIYLLKAFSLFKKRQLSNLRLVISGIPSPALREKLASYKYRQDVHWRDPATDGDRLPAAAYATLLLFEKETLGGPLLDAWKDGVPVVVLAGGRLQEMAGDAALTAGPADPAALAGSMMSLYKDEARRSGLIGKGHSRLEAFDAQRSIGTVRATICGLQHKFN
jgi:glycosyltransferase involved in cell wall biosynthesis